MIKGNKINKLLNIGAAHALYRDDGKWYHPLKSFPGVLFDKNGMLLFTTNKEYADNKSLQHGQDLHIDQGIASIAGYKPYTNDQKNILAGIFTPSNLSDIEKEWKEFLKKAKQYKINNEIFVSPQRDATYQILSTKKNVVVILRLNTNTTEQIDSAKFTACITNINTHALPMQKKSIYDNVAIECTIVELLPMLDWNEQGTKIIYNQEFRLENHADESPENNARDERRKALVSITIRRGQKKLRDKTFAIIQWKMCRK